MYCCYGITEQEEQVQVLEKELQECHDEREEDMRHIESLKTDIEKLRRQVDHSQPSSMETTGRYKTSWSDWHGIRITFSYVNISGFLRGVDVIAETSVLITNQAQTFNWAGYGLKLDVPKGTLPAGLEECRLLIKVGLSGQFALPENTSLVSAVYWLDSEPRQEFSKHLTLEIQHCVKPTDTSKLSFVRAKCSQTDLPYKFKNVEGGVFSSSSAYGCVQCNHFSLFGAVSDMYDRLYNRLVPQVQLYYASIYYLRKGVKRIGIYFVITKNLETHATVSSELHTVCVPYSFCHLLSTHISTVCSTEVQYQGCHTWRRNGDWVWIRQHLIARSYPWRWMANNFSVSPNGKMCTSLVWKKSQQYWYFISSHKILHTVLNTVNILPVAWNTRLDWTVVTNKFQVCWLIL